MARRNSSLATASDAVSIDDAVAAMMSTGSELFDQWMQTQAQWLSSWLEWQAQCLLEFQRQAGELPAWMIWQNGTEQLA